MSIRGEMMTTAGAKRTVLFKGPSRPPGKTATIGTIGTTSGCTSIPTTEDGDGEEMFSWFPIPPT